jgi:Sap, sulfolipid-1-addressing protein
MLDLWANLAPLIVVSAILPAQTIVALRLARASVKAAFAWVAGMTVIRLAQGIVFGVVLAESEANSPAESSKPFLGTLLLVLAILLYVKALRKAVDSEDEDAPPPRWLARVGSMSPLTAFAAGAGFMTLSVKFLVFTLAAIAAIAEAHLGTRLSVLMFLLFVALAQIAPFTILALAVSSPERSAAILDEFSAWLRRNNRVISILFGLVFGTWFLLKSLKQLNVIRL